jgi:toxin ParE1/3/4
VKVVEVTPAAKRDLLAIWDYIAAVNQSAADRVIKKIVSVVNRLARQTGLGGRCDELRAGMRQFPVRPYEYVVFYEASDDGIRVIRVLHGRRDFPTVFRDEPPQE